MKEVTLRIIDNQNCRSHQECCLLLCCVDVVTTLGLGERVIILSCGFIRKNTDRYIPSEIIYLCVNYVGPVGKHGIAEEKLKTQTEYRDERNTSKVGVWTVICVECADECYGQCLTYKYRESCIKKIKNTCDKAAKCLTNPYCCCGYGVQITQILLALLSLILSIITFGKDIIGFIIYSQYDCNINDLNQ